MKDSYILLLQDETENKKMYICVHKDTPLFVVHNQLKKKLGIDNQIMFFFMNVLLDGNKSIEYIKQKYYQEKDIIEIYFAEV